MYRLVLYKLPKSGRWRWKIVYQDNVLARADNHYASKSAARKAFQRFIKKAASYDNGMAIPELSEA